MRNINTDRAKSPKDRASEVMIATGFYKKLESELKVFGLDLVKADKAIGTSGHEEDWPVRHSITNPHSTGYRGSPHGPFWWYIDSPCWDDPRVDTHGSSAHVHWMMENGDGKMLNADYLTTKVGEGESYSDGVNFVGDDDRDQNVPVSMFLNNNSNNNGTRTLTVKVVNSHGIEVTERAAIDNAAAKDLAKVMVSAQCNRVRLWLQERKNARTVLLNEANRRDVLGEYGQGGHWFVCRSDPGEHEGDSYSILNGNEINRDGVVNCSSKHGYMELYKQPLKMVKRLHNALMIPQELTLVGKEYLKLSTHRLEQQEAKNKWVMGYHANQWSIMNDLAVENAHRMMRTPPPIVPEIPRRFRTLRKETLVKERTRVRNPPPPPAGNEICEEFQMSALVAEEATLPWSPLDPQTISGLQHTMINQY